MGNGLLGATFCTNSEGAEVALEMALPGSWILIVFGSYQSQKQGLLPL